MKKRNKKYNPKQIVKQKVHKFQMTWEVNEAMRRAADEESKLHEDLIRGDWSDWNE